MEKFKMTDVGDVSFVLRMQITRDRETKTSTISQEYTKSILERFGMANCKPVGTPGFGSELSTEQPEETLLSNEETCLLYTSPSPRDRQKSRMPSSA